MSHPIVRLTSVSLTNFKNVRHGEVQLRHVEGHSADILALYGQNGSGKTSLINALWILKTCLTGSPLSRRAQTFISFGCSSATIAFGLTVMESSKRFRVVYEVTLSRRDSDGLTDVAGQQNILPVYISREVLKIAIAGGSSSTRLRTVMDTGRGDTFGPDTVRRQFIGDSKDILFDMAVAKRVSQRESRSFLFSKEFKDIWASDQQRVRKNTHSKSADAKLDDCRTVLDALAFYGFDGLFVVDTASVDTVGLSALPLFFRMGAGEGNRISGHAILKADGPVNIPDKLLSVNKRIVSSLNIVLREIVPGLEIEIRELGKITIDDGGDGQRIQLLSRRGDVVLPFDCESEGIKKIVSVLQILILMYNEPSVTVAIDELDSGVFEYLLGELLGIVADGGRGQLIFTSHNLRPLETLDKQFIVFTSTDPNNRYVRMRGVKETNNLRSLYFRSIVLGGSETELYEYTSDGEIAYAMRQAGENIE